MATPARAKKLEKSVPVKGKSVGVEPPKKGQPVPPAKPSGPAKATNKDTALGKIRQKYGEGEYQKAVKQYQQTFRGQQRTNSDIRNKDRSRGNG